MFLENQIERPMIQRPKAEAVASSKVFKGEAAQISADGFRRAGREYSSPFIFIILFANKLRNLPIRLCRIVHVNRPGLTEGFGIFDSQTVFQNRSASVKPLHGVQLVTVSHSV